MNYKNKDNISQSFGNQIHPNNLIEQISQNYDEIFILFILFLTCLYLLSEWFLMIIKVYNKINIHVVKTHAFIFVIYSKIRVKTQNISLIKLT